MSWRENALRVWAGFVRPWSMLRALHTQPEAWRRFVRVTAMQLIITVLVGAAVMAIGDTPSLVAKSERLARKTERRQQRKAIAAITSIRDGGLLNALEHLDDSDVERRGLADGGLSTDGGEWLAFAKVLQGISGDDGGVSSDSAQWLNIARAMERQTSNDEEEVAPEIDEDEVQDAGVFARVSAWVAFIVSALVIGQWVTLAFTREYQASTGRALSRLAEIEPEDADMTPRFHVDLKWLRKKVQQRVRGFVVLLPGFVALIPLWVVTGLLGVADYVMPIPTFLWAAYWWVSFTTARSARAWRDEKAAIAPLPVRWWLEHTQKTPGFRWFFPRLVGQLGLKATRRDAAPAVAMERAPFELIGLSLARLMSSLPLIRLIFRTAIDTAVAETLEKHPARTAPLPIPPDAEPTKDADT